MKTPCKNCPFKKGMQWMGAHGTAPNVHSKIEALQETARQGLFSCHKLHPESNVFAVKDMTHNDCAGFRMMLENKEKPGTHKNIVSGFNETGPDYDLIGWFRKSCNDMNVLKLI